MLDELNDFIQDLVCKGRTCFNDLEPAEARQITGLILQDGETLCDVGEFLPDEFFTKVVAPAFSSNELDKEPLLFYMVVLFVKRIINYHANRIDSLLEEEMRKRRMRLLDASRIFQQEGFYDG